jgi:hypothetical protein
MRFIVRCVLAAFRTPQRSLAPIVIYTPTSTTIRAGIGGRSPVWFLSVADVIGNVIKKQLADTST